MKPLYLLLGAVAACMFAIACAAVRLSGPNADDIVQYGAALAHCEQVGRDATDGGHWAAYQDCKREAGIQ